jgi:hypothetical protein
MLTESFFQQERISAGKSYELIAKETGFHPWVVFRLAHRLGFDAVHPRTISIDFDWLREQIEVFDRTNLDIGRELGISHETIRRHRQNLGLPSPGLGHFSDSRRYPELPAVIRSAVEGQYGGWSRLQRFQHIACFESFRDAAEAFQVRATTISMQLHRLEQDIGAKLVDRATRAQPMRLTPQGQHLLELLNLPQVREVMEEQNRSRTHRRFGKPHPPQPEERSCGPVTQCDDT